MATLTWGHPEFLLFINAPHNGPVTLSVSDTSGVDLPKAKDQAMVDVLTVEHGHGLTNTRINRSLVGDTLRYVSHDASDTRLSVAQESPLGVCATTVIERIVDGGVYRAHTVVENTGSAPVHLQAVTSLALRGLTGLLGDETELDVWSARNEWDGENRWFPQALDSQSGIPQINAPAHSQGARGSIHRTGFSNWSTGDWLPLGTVTHRESGTTLLWQLEHNGPWRWELNSQYSREDWISLSLSGPTDMHHAWLQPLAPGEAFTSIPVSIARAESLDAAFGLMTRHRRASHLRASDPASRALVFNDYMNTLMGDPTTEKLLPLIDAASDAGVEYFCIDCGWYDDDGDWWPSVGAWEPAKTRFEPGGLLSVLAHIRERGMHPGLWLEPEVVGVNSPVAQQLPDEAFMTRAGVRIREHDRYLLDFRSPATREYLDGVFDRILGEYGVKFIKWDYNVTPGIGPDGNAASPGQALFEHAQAHLDWFVALRERYPDVIFESCSSGAQRQDPAITSRYDFQSSSDQQDYRLYAAIAAAAPAILAPEQAGNWAYPHASMTDEQIAFCMINGLAGRMYMSGYLNMMTADQRQLIKEATAVYPEVIEHNSVAVPFWPLGLPAWKDGVVCLGLADGDTILLYVWNRSESTGRVALPISGRAGQRPALSTVFPSRLAAWDAAWNEASSAVELDLTGIGESARILKLTF